MPVWKLTPTDLADPAWQASKHRGAAVARAASENAARRVTALTFRLGDTSEGAPWINPALVKAEQIEDARYDPTGASAVLDPAA